MIAVVEPAAAEAVADELARAGESVSRLGEITPAGDVPVTYVGSLDLA
jgi:hypothetical protein